MPVPSFEQLLSQIRQVTEEEAEAAENIRRAEIFGKSVAGSLQTIFGTPLGGEKQEIFKAALTPQGTIREFEKPEIRGGETLLSRLLFEKEPSQLRIGEIPITSETAEKIAIEKAKFRRPVPSREEKLGSQFPDLSSTQLEELFNVKGITPETTYSQLSTLQQGKFQEAGTELRKQRFKATEESKEKNLVIRYQQNFESNLKDKVARISSVNNIKGLIEAEGKDRNSVASAATGAAVAKLMGEVGMLSEADVTRYTQSNQLTQKIADKMLLLFLGRKSYATLGEIAQITDILENTIREDSNATRKRFAENLSANAGIEINEALKMFSISGFEPKSKPKPSGEPEREKPVEKMELKSPSGIGFTIKKSK